MRPEKGLAVTWLFTMLVLGLSGCNPGGGDPKERPVLSETPISLVGPYNSVAKTFGEVNFRDKAFIPFGAPLTSATINCAFEYYTTATALVHASCDGEIVFMFKNSGVNDYEIHIKSFASSYWSVQHDHVSNPQVQQGAQVKAGDVLGGTGEWNQAQGIGRTELVVTYSEGPGNDMAYCPLDFGTAKFVQGHEELRAALNAHGFGPFPTFCLAETVKP
jgi:hypothetical protein